MAGRELTVTLNAKDGMSKTFKAVADGSTKMGDAVEQAGMDGKKGMDQLGKSAEANADKMERVKAEATAIGAVMGTLAAGVAKAGEAYRDQERQIDVVNRLYEDQADVVLDLAEAIQDTTRYSNDAAREAIIMFGSLSQNYGVTTDQVEDLTAATLDLSAAFGYDLVQTATDVSAAIRGEAEAIEKYGVAMSDTFLATEAAARGMDGWTTTMTEAEKAAFRYTILLEQVAAYQGVAASQAENAGGAFRQFTNDMQDAVQGVGGLLGPVGQVAAEMAPLAIAAPVVGAGLANIGRSALVARAGMGALALATNPVALGLTAIVGVGALVYENMQRQSEAAENYTASLVTLGDTIEWLRLQGEDVLADMAEGVKADVDDAIQSIDELTTYDLAKRFSLEMAVAQQLLQKMIVEDFGGAADAVDDVMARIDESLREPNVDQEEYLSWISEMLDGVKVTAEGSNVDEVFEEILTRPLSDFRDEAGPAVAAMDDIGTGIDRLNAKRRSSLEILSEMETAERDLLAWETERERTAYANQEISLATRREMAEEGAAVVTAALEGWAEAQSAVNQATMEWLSNGDNILGFLVDFGTATQGGTEAWRAFTDEFNAGFTTDQLNQSFDQVLRIFDQIDSLGSRTSAAGAIADALFGEGGDPYDGIGPMVELLDEGRISYEQFIDTVNSGVSIQALAAQSQESLNKIRVDQLPLLEAEQRAYTKNINALSEMEPLEQRRALMLQDSAVQAEIATLYSQAYAASVGEIPEEVATSMILQAAEADAGLKDLLLQFGLLTEEDGEISVAIPDGDSVQASIEGLTDSIDALIVTMGGIPPLRIDADASIAEVVIDNLIGILDGVDGSVAGISILGDSSQAVDAINRALLDLYGLDGQSAMTWQYGTNTDAVDKVATVDGMLTNLDGDTATVYINAVNNAGAAIGAVASQLINLDGDSATTYVDTVYRSFGTPGGNRAHGGMVDHFAHGGSLVPFWGGENGPELAHFAGGGTALLPHEGLYAAPPMTYISPNNAVSNNYGGDTHVHVTVTGNVYGVDDLTAQVAEKLATELTRAIREQERGMGML